MRCNTLSTTRMGWSCTPAACILVLHRGCFRAVLGSGMLLCSSPQTHLKVGCTCPAGCQLASKLRDKQCSTKRVLGLMQHQLPLQTGGSAVCKPSHVIPRTAAVERS